MDHNISAVAFDKDGVIFDSEIIYAKALMAVGKEYNVQFPLPLLEQFIGLAAQKTLQLLMDHIGDKDKTYQLVNSWLMRVSQLKERDGLQTIAGVIEILNYLQSKNYPLALVTSDSYENVKRDFNDYSKANLLAYFTVTVTIDDVQKCKPDAEPYQRAAALLGVDARQMAVIEDSDYGARAAIASGARVFLLPGKRKLSPQQRAAVFAVMTTHHELKNYL